MTIQALVKSAQSGNQEAIMELVHRYMWLIDKYSKRSGTLDDDCKQTVILEVIKAIRRYTPNP